MTREWSIATGEDARDLQLQDFQALGRISGSSCVSKHQMSGFGAGWAHGRVLGMRSGFVIVSRSQPFL